LLDGVTLLTPAPARLRPKVVERGRPRHAEEPGPLGASTRVEAAPGAKRLLEGLGGQLFRECGVAGEKEQIAVDIV
jgi:hypothetical protein